MGMMIHRHDVKPVPEEKPVEKQEAEPIKEDRPKKKRKTNV